MNMMQMGIVRNQFLPDGTYIATTYDARVVSQSDDQNGYKTTQL